ncbi:hypothetical protein BH18ACT17_BH18ACT17_01770 [soil metagenome]
MACDGCIYVGVGASGELTGAAAVGTVPYLLLDPDLDHESMLTPERDEWAGASIAHLQAGLDLVP